MSHIHIGLSGRYTIEKRNAAGDVVQTLEFDNLITDAGLERWGTDGVGNVCYLGSGSTTPSVTETVMPPATLLGSTTNTATAPANTYHVPTLSQTRHNTWRFGPGVGTGNVREVGVGWGTGLWSRALVLDGNGNPTTLEKLADETLDVTYALKLAYPAEVTGTTVVDGVPRSWRARPVLSSGPSYFSSLMNSSRRGLQGYNYAYSGALPDGYVTLPSGSGPYTTDYTISSYVPGSKAFTVTIRYGVDKPGTYRTLYHSFGPYMGAIDVLFEYTPAIQVLATQALTFVLTQSWGRA